MQQTEMVGEELRKIPGAESVRRRTMGNDLNKHTEWLVRGDVSGPEVRRAAKRAFDRQGYYDVDLNVYRERDGAVVVSPGASLF